MKNTLFGRILAVLLVPVKVALAIPYIAGIYIIKGSVETDSVDNFLGWPVKYH
jgi:hypothetical protein